MLTHQPAPPSNSPVICTGQEVSYALSVRSFSFSFRSLVSFSLDLTLFPLLHRTHIASLRFVALNFLRWLDDDVASLDLASSRWKHQVCLPTSNRHVSTDLRVQPTVRITYLRPAVPLLLFLLLSFSFPLVLSLFPSSAFARAIHAPRYSTTYLADLERAARNRCLQLPPRNILLKDCSLRTQTIRMLPRPAITVPRVNSHYVRLSSLLVRSRFPLRSG